MRYVLIALGVLILDQLTKVYVRGSFSLYESREILPGLFHFTYIENPGAAFGMFANQRSFFLIITALIMLFMMYFMYTLEKEEPSANPFLAMVLGGALGNFIDRFQKGTVTDFLDFLIWPVFNVADSFIVVGMAMVAWKILRHENKEREAKVEKSEL